MVGKYNGSQAHILQENEFVRFVPTTAHSLVLVGTNAASLNNAVLAFFWEIQRIFTFFQVPATTGKC